MFLRHLGSPACCSDLRALWQVLTLSSSFDIFSVTSPQGSYCPAGVSSPTLCAAGTWSASATTDVTGCTTNAWADLNLCGGKCSNYTIQLFSIPANTIVIPTYWAPTAMLGSSTALPIINLTGAPAFRALVPQVCWVVVWGRQ